MNITVTIPDDVADGVAEAIRGNRPPVAPAPPGPPLAEGETPPEPPPEPTSQQVIEEYVRNQITALYRDHEGRRAADKARQTAERRAERALGATADP